MVPISWSLWLLSLIISTFLGIIFKIQILFQEIKSQLLIDILLLKLLNGLLPNLNKFQIGFIEVNLLDIIS